MGQLSHHCAYGGAEMSRHLRYSLNVLPFVVALSILMILPRLERALLPVVTGFVVTSMTKTPEHVVLSGYMRKDRDCIFVGVQAVAIQDAHEHDVPLIFLDARNNNATRPQGSQAWGPWKVTVPALYADSIKLISTHRCHPFYTTDTELASIPLRAD